MLATPAAQQKNALKGATARPTPYMHSNMHPTLITAWRNPAALSVPSAIDV